MVAAIVLVVIIVLLIKGYQFDWTGFNGNNKSGKTLWDWLQLLIIPLVLAVGALLFNLATTRTEQKIASDKQREDLLQAYLDRMSELLLKEKLRSSAVDAEVRNVARVRTIAVLFQLDTRRIGYVFAFLREAGLMSNKPTSAEPTSAEPTSAEPTSAASLDRANLSRANLKDASGITIEELEKQARLLKGATMPDGSIHP